MNATGWLSQLNESLAEDALPEDSGFREEGTGRLIFTDLEPYTWYRLLITAEDTQHGNLSFSILTNVDRPSKVEELLASWAEPGRTVRLSWKAPQTRNGPIDG